MSIWTYADSVADRSAVASALALQNCPFCAAELYKLKDERDEKALTPRLDIDTKLKVLACPICGWWSCTKSEFSTLDLDHKEIRAPAPHRFEVFGAAASLRSFDVSDVSAPVEEIRAYLSGRYDARFRVDPKKFEETVASVFGDLGYEAKVTAYSGDDGIDVVLDGPEGEEIGIQVKRYKGSIEVGQIRALAGALVLRGLTKGIFVTTSRFQSGAPGTVERFAEKDMRIELVDAPRFMDALKIAQRARYQSVADSDAPFLSASMMRVRSESHPVFDANIWEEERMDFGEGPLF